MFCGWGQNDMWHMSQAVIFSISKSQIAPGRQHACSHTPLLAPTNLNCDMWLWYVKHFLLLTPKTWSYLFYHNSCRVCAIYQPYSGVISASTLCNQNVECWIGNMQCWKEKQTRCARANSISKRSAALSIEACIHSCYLMLRVVSKKFPECTT